MMDLCQIKKDFSQMVLQAPQWTLTQFVLWLDLKVAEYKVNGYMVLDDKTKTVPRWIEEDVLETQPTAPRRHMHWGPCGHRHEKRRRKWRRWLENGGPHMGHGPGKRCHREQASMAASASNQDHTMVEISDESCGDSDNFEILESWSPGSDTLRVQNSSSPEKQPLPLFLSKTNSERYIPVELQPVSKVALPRRGSTDSMVENVNQISISNDGQRRFENVDNASSSISGTPQVQQAKETDIAQGINNSHVASNTLPSDERDHRGRSRDTEIMVIQDTEDIKPDVVMLQKESGMQDADTKDGDKSPYSSPLSPVTSALISYQAEGWPKRTDSPSEHSSSGMNQHPEEIPDLLDANTRRCLNAGQVKLVWNKVVGVCASYLVHQSKGQPSSTDYQWLCKAMYEKYPALGSNKGPNPWSGFNRAVSQKIRHTRYKMRQMGRTSNYQDEQRLRQMAQTTMYS